MFADHMGIAFLVVALSAPTHFLQKRAGTPLYAEREVLKILSLYAGPSIFEIGASHVKAKACGKQLKSRYGQCQHRKQNAHFQLRTR